MNSSLNGCQEKSAHLRREIEAFKDSEAELDRLTSYVEKSISNIMDDAQFKKYAILFFILLFFYL